MILIRAALIRIFQSLVIGALSLGIVAVLLITYCFIAGDRQDRAEMFAAVDNAASIFKQASVKNRGLASSASFKEN